MLNKNKSATPGSEKHSASPLHLLHWPNSGGLQARMMFSYVWMTALFVLLIEMLAVFLFIVLLNNFGERSDLVLEQRIGIQYAYMASLQSDGLALNPRTTFLPGQPYSLVLPGDRVPGENERRTTDLLNLPIPLSGIHGMLAFFCAARMQHEGRGVNVRRRPSSRRGDASLTYLHRTTRSRFSLAYDGTLFHVGLEVSFPPCYTRC